MKGPVLVLGATSPIARAAAGALAARGHGLYLASRDPEELSRIAADLSVRHKADVAWGRFDAEDFAGHEKFLDEVSARVGDLEGVLLAFGRMGDQEAAARDAARARALMDVNATAAISILTLCAAQLERRRGGFIVGLSSVAGDRGRRRNYPYGAAKGALSLYLQGLRARLHPAGVRVLTVKLGFVDTPMTFGLPGMFLVASPRDVGERIVRALDRGRDVIYIPWFWRCVMWIVRMIPEAIHKRLDY
jgi:short-subunit dehydrogenase